MCWLVEGRGEPWDEGPACEVEATELPAHRRPSLSVTAFPESLTEKELPVTLSSLLVMNPLGPWVL